MFEEKLKITEDNELKVKALATVLHFCPIVISIPFSFSSSLFFHLNNIFFQIFRYKKDNTL